ncbi:MAG: choice-of-anchor A family protein [Hyalangium sp.]|uniref:choice-of-anchor A family protein n=1 Tax=Hyalangium sp. TaxID=2028555 RepID=UPI00389A10E5
MKRLSIYRLVFLAFTATACGAPEMTGSQGKAETPPLQLTNTQPALSYADDTTPPQSTITTTPAPDANGEFHGNVSIQITATDDAAGVANISWTLSGMHSGGAVTAGSSAWVPVISREGTTTLTYYAKDNNNNTETAHTFVVNITPPPPECRDVELSDFNLFLTGDYSGGHDMRGKVAAGGNIDMHYFSLGAELHADDTENVLVAGASLNISNGGIFGDAHYGDTVTADGTATFYRGSLSQGSPIDFFSRADGMYQLSSVVAGLTAKGSTQFQSWGGLFLQGSDPKVNVFNVTGSQLSATRYFSLSVPSGSVAVINVSGYEATVANFSNAYSGVDATGVLFNFPDASYIHAFNYGFFGTVLAPYAHIDFSNGSFDGGIYAESLTGNAEGHLAPLRLFQVCGYFSNQ